MLTGPEAMPVFNNTTITPQQKRDIIEHLTEAMVTNEGENMRSVTWVVVEVVDSGDWGIGGNALTTADVAALAAGTPAR